MPPLTGWHFLYAEAINCNLSFISFKPTRFLKPCRLRVLVTLRLLLQGLQDLVGIIIILY